MRLGSRTRKAVLTVHVTASVAWIGAVAAYLVFDITTATSGEAASVRSAYMAMAAITTRVLIPLALLAWGTGIVMALGTPWGLLRHYWVAISLALTTLAVIVLIVEWSVIAALAEQAASSETSDSQVLSLPSTLPHSIGGLAVLLFVNALNIIKPRGLTRYGWQKARKEGAQR